MKSFQIVWSLDDVEVHHFSGSDYVRAATSKKAKDALEAHLRAKCPHAVRIEIGRAIQRQAPTPSLYIGEVR